MKLIFKTFFIVCISIVQINLNAQYRFIKANSSEDDRLISTNLGLINTNRFYPQSAELIAQTQGSNSNISILQNEFSNKNFNYFSWNNPEYLVNKKIKFTNWDFIKKLGPNSLYQNPNRFYSWESKDRKDYFVINPVLDLSYARKSAFSDSLLFNGRGLEFYGQFGDKFTFYTQLMDYQADYTKSIDNYKDSLHIYPGIGKFYRNSFNYVDYFYTTGYVSGKLLEKKEYDSTTKKDALVYQIVATFGNDKQFIGNGYRSLILSDFAAPSLFFQVNYKLGPFKYQNLFKELIGDLSIDSNKILNKKYLALHRASLEFEKVGLELGLTEMIVQSRSNNGFDANYFNPVIFYRAVERDLGSGDNALIALDAKYKKGPFLFYTQFVLDEFSVGKAFTTNSYLNKFAFQLGGYYRPQLSFMKQGYLNLEFNQVRPYTYSHWSTNYYSSYNQALAHPLESNFREVLFRLFFVPQNLQRWSFRNITSFAFKGFDLSGDNYGSNIRKSYYTAIEKNNAFIGQGDKSSIFNTFNEITYYAMPNLLLQFTQQFRSQSNIRQSNNYLYISIKYNFTQNRNQYLF